MLIFATRRPPWPPDNGARIRALRLAQGLARHFELTLVTFADGPSYDATTASREDLEAALPGVSLELVRYLRKPPGGARRNVFRRRSETYGHYATTALRAVLRRLVKSHPDAILHLDDPGVALAGIELGAALTAVAPHNIEYRIIADIGRRLSLAHRPFVALEARKLAAEERRVWRAADLCVAVSELDAQTMRAAGAERVVVIPNGSDPHEPLPPPVLPADAPVRLLFVGSLHFEPYRHGMAWFVREALPLIRTSVRVSVEVVGDRPADLPRAPEVVYHGRVPDVQPFYERAHALAVPVFEGSGTRLKLVEAALLGRPIISTALGAEALPLRAGEHYLHAEDAEGFAAAVRELRAELVEHSPAVVARLAAARAAVAHLTWPQIADELAEVYRTSVR